MTKKQSYYRAFTAVEVLIVICIMTLIAGLSITSFISFSKRQALDASAQALASGLRDARNQTLASVNASQYGVSIDTHEFIFFKGSMYDYLEPTNKVFTFSTHVNASSSLSTVVFQRLTGNSSSSGTINLYLISDPSIKRTITVSGSGLVNISK